MWPHLMASLLPGARISVSIESNSGGLVCERPCGDKRLGRRDASGRSPRGVNLGEEIGAECVCIVGEGNNLRMVHRHGCVSPVGPRRARQLRFLLCGEGK
jgi:hypothetical protein